MDPRKTGSVVSEEKSRSASKYDGGRQSHSNTKRSGFVCHGVHSPRDLCGAFSVPPTALGNAGFPISPRGSCVSARSTAAPNRDSDVMRRQVVINADIHGACGVSDESLKRPSAGSIWRRGGAEYNDSRLTRPDRSTRALRVEQFIIEWVGEHVKRALEPSDARAGRRELPDGHDGREFASLCPEAQPGEGQSITFLPIDPASRTITVSPWLLV